MTGGQRIDLFGAEVHQLPAIWRVLVDAGFETGHAYGKALRLRSLQTSGGLYAGIVLERLHSQE